MAEGRRSRWEDTGSPKRNTLGNNKGRSVIPWTVTVAIRVSIRNRSVDSPDVRHASHSRRDHHAGQKQTAAKSRAQYMQRLCKELLTTRISSFQFPPLSVGLTLEPPQSLYAAG
jgi:hypothetical protein